ncbi:MAG: 6-carboxytetrahydropterin synthase [Cyclobacteriaceae bacterium]|nr:6-carboxytetrahydropterin synthase [Cyclobacteriaceae bacterium]
MAYITRKEHFNAAHKLYNPKWSKEKNEEVFGPCANENWHGHNFDLEVTVCGEPEPDTGFVVNFKDLGRLIKDEILEKVDHKNLNLDVDFMIGILPSCENIAIEFWKILSRKLPSITSTGKLYKIKVTETPGNFVEYYGESTSLKL